MKNLKKALRAAGAKLRGRAGESLAETLIALLIAALAVTMLAGMITAATSMVRKSYESFTAYQTASNVLAVQGSGEGSGGKAGKASLAYVTGGASVYLVGGSKTDGQENTASALDVTCYSNGKAPEDTPVVSFRYHPIAP